MKYVVLLSDGMSDYKIDKLGGQTPLAYARTPNMDFLASKGEIGIAATVPDGFPPGSDVANLSVMGYDPKKYYSGRSPLEAVSMGVELADSDVAFRCNLVTLSGEDKYEEKSMVDYSADEITTPEAGELIRGVNEQLGGNGLVFHTGFRFRHLLVWQGGPDGMKLTPPHDISGRVIGEYLPGGDGGDILFELMKESNSILAGHPVNLARIKQGLRPANSVWFWGQGRKPALPKYFDKYGLTGSVISAVDLIKGIGICAGLDIVQVEDVTGTVDTNFKGKVAAALKELDDGKDFVYVHVEAPDAASHRGETQTKIRAIEMVDEMLGLLLAGLEQYGRFKIMLLPDHFTPLSTMTHWDGPVPFAIYTKGSEKNNKNAAYTEEAAAGSGLFFDGYKLMDYFIGA
ncbi:MAG: cofactor-independent phosphoglycerate mutase [Desulfotomaculaceae bacterium]